jgi:two-component system OmpR family sensor kinase
MFRSIRWNLLGWYAAILLAVIAGFGTTLYQRLQTLRYQRVDTELAGAAQLIAQRTRPPHRPRGHSTAPEPEPQISIPESLLQRFGADENEAAYAVLWQRDGARYSSAQAPEDMPAPKPLKKEDPDRPRFRQRGDLREVILPRHSGGYLVVGRSMKSEEEGTHRLVLILAGTGLGVLIIGLAGGWILVERALRPIAVMSSTAAVISASNLSQRIDVAGTESELGPLALVLNNMLDRLEDAFEQQKRFTADASHELRTPLAVICSQAELALARERSTGEYRQALTTCSNAAQRMRLLVNGLLTLARTDAGMLQLERAPFDLRLCVEECAQMVHPLAEERGITLDLDLSEVEWAGDAHRIAQVVTNLLSNAIRYNRDGGRVRVSLRQADGEVVLAVADTGIGIPHDDLGSIFKRFYRVDKARSREMGGTGLGLAICQGLVSAHGGVIECVSDLGRGSTFTVRLPATAVAEEAGPQIAEALAVVPFTPQRSRT